MAKTNANTGDGELSIPGFEKILPLPYVTLCNYHTCLQILQQYIFNLGRFEGLSIVHRTGVHSICIWKVQISYDQKVRSSENYDEWRGYVPPVQMNQYCAMKNYMDFIAPRYYSVHEVYFECIYNYGKWHDVWSVEFRMAVPLEPIEGPPCPYPNKKKAPARKEVLAKKKVPAKKKAHVKKEAPAKKKAVQTKRKLQ